jgi:hypothetical protein
VYLDLHLTDTKQRSAPSPTNLATLLKTTNTKFHGNPFSDFGDETNDRNNEKGVHYTRK